MLDNFDDKTSDGMAGQLGWECRLEWADTTVHIHLSVPSRDWIVRCTIGLSGWPSDMPAGRTQRLPSVCAVGMAGQLGWECRLEWADTTVHIHLSVPSRDWIARFTIGLSGWPSDMPAGRTQRLPVGQCRRQGRAAGLGVPTRVAQHNCPHPSFSSQ